MATSKDNYVTAGLRGAIGKEWVYRQVDGKTRVSKYPDRSQVKYNKKQTRFQKIFAAASVYASDIINDPVKRAAYKLGHGKSVYHADNFTIVPLDCSIDLLGEVVLRHLNQSERKLIPPEEIKQIQLILNKKAKVRSANEMMRGSKYVSIFMDEAELTFTPCQNIMSFLESLPQYNLFQTLMIFRLLASN